MNRGAIAGGLTVLALGSVIWGLSLVRNPRADAPTSERHYTIGVSPSVESVSLKSPIVIQGTLGPVVDYMNAWRDVSDLDKEADEVHPASLFEVQVTKYVRGEGPDTILLGVQGGTYKGVTEPLRYDLVSGRSYLFFVRPMPIGGKMLYVLAAAPGFFQIQGDTAVPGRVYGVRHDIPSLQTSQLLDIIARTPYEPPGPSPFNPPYPDVGTTHDESDLPGHKELDRNPGK